MSKLAELSNSFSTGDGGGNFERHVQAVFILAMIIDGFSPGINKPVTQLVFQGKRLGYDVDDLIVISENDIESTKLHCQIKHSIKISHGNSIFQEVITAAWSDFNKKTFNKDNDKIALITGFIAKESIEALRYIHNQALYSADENDFIGQIELPKFIGKYKKEKFEVIKKCLECANDNQPVSNLELWEFCKAFQLMIFDVDYAASVNRTLINSLIRCNSKQNPDAIWAALSEKAGEWNQAAASKRKTDIPNEIYKMFGIEFYDMDYTTNLITFKPDALWAQVAILGAWDENNKHDIALIEQILNINYAEFQHELHNRLMSNGNILSLVDGIWKVRNQRKLFELAKNLYFDKDVKAIFNGAKVFLNEINRQFSEDGRYDVVIPTDGKFNNSEIFRRHLLQGICLLANEEKPIYCTDDLIKQETKILINYVFENCTWMRIASLGELVSILAEMQPKTFLDCLETYISETEDIVNLFPKKTHNMFMMPNFITELLFSLELLAWSDKYIVQVIRCLGELESKQYEKTNYSNTPLNSIFNILTPFKPQTYATAEKQVLAVNALNVDMPDVCWKVVNGLLPGNRNITISSPKPRYIKCHISEMTSSDIKGLYENYERFATQLAGNNVERLAKLSKSIEFMTKTNILKYLENILKWGIHWDNNEKFIIWTRLSDLRCRIILNNDTTITDNELFKQLEQVIDSICPNDIWYKYKRLYLAQCKESVRLEDGWRKWDEKKNSAVYEIYLTYGLSSILEFADSVDNVHDVASRLGKMLNESEILDILNEYQNDIDNYFYSVVMKNYLLTHSIKTLYDSWLSEKTNLFKAKVLMDAPMTDELLTLIPVALKEKEELFWTKVPIYTYLVFDCDVDSVIEKLMCYKRPIAVINILGSDLEELHVDKSIVYTALSTATSQSLVDKYNPDAVCRLIKYLQEDNNPDIKRLSDIEFMYLPWLGDSLGVYPKTINYRLANEPEYFCTIMEAAYKRRHDTDSPKELSDTLAERLYKLVFMYSVVPGVNWDGTFSKESFRTWIEEVKKWAKENDLIEVVLQTIGNGISYAKENQEGLFEDIIMQELNAKENMEMRKGYYIGTRNQRGVHWLDPEGTEEKKLAQKFYGKARIVEKLGYTRFSETLEAIGDSYTSEAKYNIKHVSELNEDEM